ncbi:MAG: hypothetical protein MK135_15760, partial [Polyangiaceae bacterium]|nr:hypothetical protein [Polyangiaceae bacterium]
MGSISGPSALASPEVRTASDAQGATKQKIGRFINPDQTKIKANLLPKKIALMKYKIKKKKRTPKDKSQFTEKSIAIDVL